MADSAVPPSKFGAGFTTGSATAPPPAPVSPRPGSAVLNQAAPLNKLAVGTFVAALFLGLVVAPFTLPLALVAQRQIQDSGESGAGLARAAVIISGVYLIFGVVVLGLYFYI